MGSPSLKTQRLFTIITILRHRSKPEKKFLDPASPLFTNYYEKSSNHSFLSAVT